VERLGRQLEEAERRQEEAELKLSLLLQEREEELARQATAPPRVQVSGHLSDRLDRHTSSIPVPPSGRDPDGGSAVGRLPPRRGGAAGADGRPAGAAECAEAASPGAAGAAARVPEDLRSAPDTGDLSRS